MPARIVAEPRPPARQVALTRAAAVLALLLAGLGTYSERWGLAGGGAPAVAAGAVRVGDPAPPFATTTLDGTPVALEDFRGRVVVVNFWATWCPPCRVEMPEFDAYQVEMGERVAILGVNMQEPPQVVTPFVRQYALRFRILLDPSGAIASAYRVSGLPTSVIVDRAGVVRERVVGAMTRDALARRVERLL